MLKNADCCLSWYGREEDLILLHFLNMFQHIFSTLSARYPKKQEQALSGSKFPLRSRRTISSPNMLNAIYYPHGIIPPYKGFLAEEWGSDPCRYAGSYAG